MSTESERGSVPARGQAGKLTPHPLVEKLRSSVSRPESLSTLVGFVDTTGATDVVRVYGDLSFSYYCDVARADVVETAPVDPADANSPTVVWLRGEARVEFVSTVRLTGDVSFLAGQITSQHLQRSIDRTSTATGGGADADYLALRANTTWSCPVRTLEGACETRNIFCPPQMM